MCAASFDHLVGACEQRWRNFEAERLGGPKVEDQFNFRGLLDRQIGRLLALENPPGVDAGQTVEVSEIASVTHQAAGRDERAKLEDRGNRVVKGQCRE